MFKKLFRDCFDCRLRELPFVVLMFSYFFLTIATFWILKAVKKTLFIRFYDEFGVDLLGWHLSASQAELVAKILNMVVAVGAVVAFSFLASRYRRQGLTYVFSAFFLAAYVVYTRLVDSPGHFTVWSFYLFGDLYSTLMVPTFFAFLNDSVSSDGAKRLYGLIGLGGVMGGVFGSTFVAAWTDRFSIGDWLWITFGVGVAVAAIAFLAGREVAQSGPPEAKDIDSSATATETARDGNPALDGARLVSRSGYLLAIVAIVALYELSSTVLDFMFTSSVTHYLDGPEIGRHFAFVFTITNWVSMLVQLVVTSLVMRKLGMAAALLVLPAAMLLGATEFAVLPTLWAGSLLNTADNGFSYSINQSAKEALYVPTSRDEKYKAKAFIDMFVQRAAKAVAVVLSLGITMIFTDFDSIRWLSLLVVVPVVSWVYAARYAGRSFQEKCEEGCI